MGRVHFWRVLSGIEEQCVCRRPLEGVLATNVFYIGLVLRIARDDSNVAETSHDMVEGIRQLTKRVLEMDDASGASVEDCLQWKSGKHCCTYWTIQRAFSCVGRQFADGE